MPYTTISVLHFKDLSTYYLDEKDDLDPEPPSNYKFYAKKGIFNIW
jgi:hypothetical protein|tara:strand:- start:24 stop:161 length:138 start_codon:yes stop_codon:yes gene_type:complete